MAITLVGTSATNAEVSGSPASEDTYIAFVYGSGDTASAPAIGAGSWTFVGRANLDNGSSDLTYAVYKITRGASAPDFSIQLNGNISFGSACAIFCLRNADISTVALQTDAAIENPLSLQAPAVTVQSGGIALYSSAGWNGATFFGTPGGWTDVPLGFNEQSSGYTFNTGSIQPVVTNGMNDWGVLAVVSVDPITAGLSVAATVPSDNAFSVDVETQIRLTYSSAVSAGAGSYRLYLTSGDVLIQTFTAPSGFVINGNSVTLNPTDNLSTFTDYYVLADAGVVIRTSDSSPSAVISATTDFNFTTGYYGGPDMFAERIRETTTTTGTGNLTLGGAVTNYRTFNAAFGLNVPFRYYIVGAAEYETGVGVLTGSTTLQRLTVDRSSNSDALVSFSVGTKEVFCAPSSVFALQAAGAIGNVLPFMR